MVNRGAPWYQREEGTLMSTTSVILVIAAFAILLLALFLVFRRRTERLQSTFGPEYERSVQRLGKYKGESELEKRQKRVEHLPIRQLSQTDRDRFSAAWRAVQAEFVDNPATALARADELVGSVMAARGYPVQDFEQCAEDISVDHPVVVDNYRAAHSIALRCARREASTEEIRQAMIHYRTLFEDLLPAPQPEQSRLQRAI
jgi:hypothetical protein